MPIDTRFLTAGEAAAELQVSRATLYAYVSRGLIRSEPSRGRERLYHAEDVQALRARKAVPTAASAGRSLEFGEPVLASAITLIRDGRLYYRGRDALSLAASASAESVAGLLWQASDQDVFREPRFSGSSPGSPGLAAALALLGEAGEDDPRAWNLSPEAVAHAGARILGLVATAFAGPLTADGAVGGRLGRGMEPTDGR